MTVPHQARPPIRQPQILHAGQEGLGFQFDRLAEEPARPGPQHIRQEIVDRIG